MSVRYISRYLLLLGSLMAFASCEAGALSRDSPLGLWSTERGQTIEIYGDGRYKYCDDSSCYNGVYEPSGLTHVLLLDFASAPETERLREEARWVNPTEVDNEIGLIIGNNNLLFGDGGLSRGLRHRLCGGRPCMVFGEIGPNNTIRFIKVRDK